MEVVMKRAISTRSAFVILVLASAAAFTAAPACTARADDWPQFLGPSRNNVSAEKDLLSQFPDGGPKVLWSAKLGPGFAAPAVAGGKVYMLDRDGRKGDVLRCWDLVTGKQDWTFAYDAPGALQYDGSRSTPAVEGNSVFTVGAFGQVHCLDAKTHEVVWKADLQKDFGVRLPNWGFSQSPLLYKDTIILSPQGKGAGVVALEKTTGKVVWKTRQYGVTCYDSPMLAMIDGNETVLSIAAVSNTVSNVSGIDPEKGTILWSYKGWGRMFPIPGPVDLGGGRILLSAEYGASIAMIQVKRAEGDANVYKVEEVFNLSKTTTMASQLHQPFLIKDHLYFVSNGFDRADGLVCMDLAGKVVWKTGKAPNFDLGGSILADDKLYLLDGKPGDLRIVQPDPAGYKQLASAKVLQKGQMWGPLVISDGKLLVRDQETLKCLDIRAAGAK